MQPFDSNVGSISGRVRVNFSLLPDPGKGGWAIDKENFFSSAATTRFLRGGTHTVRFKPVMGFSTPSPFTFIIRTAENVVLDAAYVKLVAPTITTGTLRRGVIGETYAARVATAKGRPTSFAVTSDLPGEVKFGQAGTACLLTIDLASGLNAVSGSYHISVTATNLQGSMTRTFPFEIVPKGNLTIRHIDVTDAGAFEDLGSPVDGPSSPPVGDIVTKMAAPKAGFLFKQWNGFGITGLPSENRKLTFTMSPTVTLFAEFVRSPFPARTGVYTGLLKETLPRFETSGLTEVKLSAGGLYTGTISYGASSYPFKGAFKVDGSAFSQVTRRGTSPLDLELNFDPTLPDGSIRGTVSGEIAAAGVRQALSFTARLPAMLSEAKPFVMVLPPDPAHTDIAYPQGTSVATLSVSAKGVVKTTLHLADGTATVVNGYLLRGGTPAGYPLFCKLYGGAGSLLGDLTMNPNTGVISGQATWFRNGQFPGQRLTGPWPVAGLRSTVHGEAFRKSPSQFHILSGLARSQEDTRFSYDAADLVTTSGALSATGVFTASPGQAMKGFSITISSATGAISGTRPVAGGKPWLLGGVLLQSGSRGIGYTLKSDRSDPLKLELIP